MIKEFSDFMKNKYSQEAIFTNSDNLLTIQDGKVFVISDSPFDTKFQVGSEFASLMEMFKDSESLSVKTSKGSIVFSEGNRNSFLKTVKQGASFTQKPTNGFVVDYDFHNVIKTAMSMIPSDSAIKLIGLTESGVFVTNNKTCIEIRLPNMPKMNVVVDWESWKYVKSGIKMIGFNENYIYFYYSNSKVICLPLLSKPIPDYKPILDFESLEDQLTEATKKFLVGDDARRFHFAKFSDKKCELVMRNLIFETETDLAFPHKFVVELRYLVPVIETVKDQKIDVTHKDNRILFEGFISDFPCKGAIIKATE